MKCLKSMISLLKFKYVFRHYEWTTVGLRLDYEHVHLIPIFVCWIKSVEVAPVVAIALRVASATISAQAFRLLVSAPVHRIVYGQMVSFYVSHVLMPRNYY